MTILLDRIKSNMFLPQSPGGLSKNYVGPDSVSLYKNSLKTMPIDWYYRDNEIVYETNSLMYRTVEFDTIDWSNSVVIFGCSNVFGVGLHTENTISEQLSRLINKPVINMGAPASSILYNLHNNVILRNYPTPLGVVNMWTHYNRQVYYHAGEVRHLGAWKMDGDDYMDHYTRVEANPITNAYLNTMTARSLWSHTRYYECSMFGDTSELLKCDHIKQTDYARDLTHPGIETAFTVAKLIRDKLCL
jgi:hypothetical protein